MQTTTDYRKDRRHKTATTGRLQLAPASANIRTPAAIRKAKNRPTNTSLSMCQATKPETAVHENATTTTGATIKSP